MSLFPIFSPGGKEFSLLGTATASASVTTYTFSSQPLGAASASRRIVVAFASEGDDSSALLINSATINGVSATVVVTNGDTNGSNASLCTAIIIANVPTGTSGNVVLTANQITSGDGIISVYRLDGFDSYSAFDTASDDDSTVTLDLNAPGSGSVIVAGAINVTGALTPNGFTADFTASAGLTAKLIVGSASPVAAESPRSVSIGSGASGVACGVAASFA